MTGERWFAAFGPSFRSGDSELIIAALSLIVKAERKDGMVEASRIAACHDIGNADSDTVAREIAREIREIALEDQ